MHTYNYSQPQLLTCLLCKRFPDMELCIALLWQSACVHTIILIFMCLYELPITLCGYFSLYNFAHMMKSHKFEYSRFLIVIKPPLHTFHCSYWSLSVASEAIACCNIKFECVGYSLHNDRCTPTPGKYLYWVSNPLAGNYILAIVLENLMCWTGHNYYNYYDLPSQASGGHYVCNGTRSRMIIPHSLLLIALTLTCYTGIKSAHTDFQMKSQSYI